MITCPYCQKELLEGTVICPECGSSLVDESAPQARSSRPTSGTDPLSRRVSPTAGSSRTTAHITTAQLRLLVLNSGRTIYCPMAEVILVGRADAAGGIFPEVDLNQDNGYMAGVSRRHARIVRRGEEFFLEDLGSVNGTFLNRTKLAAHTPTAFFDGDEIRLGNLVMRVILEEDRP